MKVETEIVHGEPLEVEGRIFIPIARRTVAVQHRASITPSRVSARSAGFVRLRPLALVEQAMEDRSTPAPCAARIPDRTAQALRGLLALALIVPALLMLAARWARR